MAGFALVDCARSGVENMALDQRMPEVASEQQCLLLRVYHWSEPTVSLGYFQPYAERVAHQPSSALATVRRSTGGGAIVHHYDWTYCVAIPESFVANISKPSAAKTDNTKIGTIGASQPLYDCIHDEVVACLNELGFPAIKWSKACDVEKTQNAGFLHLHPMHMVHY